MPKAGCQQTGIFGPGSCHPCYSRIFHAPVPLNSAARGICENFITATDFARNAVRMTMTQTERHRSLPADPPEHVAEKILEAVETEAAEVYADSIRPSV